MLAPQSAAERIVLPERKTKPLRIQPELSVATSAVPGLLCDKSTRACVGIDRMGPDQRCRAFSGKPLRWDRSASAQGSGSRPRAGLRLCQGLRLAFIVGALCVGAVLLLLQYPARADPAGPCDHNLTPLPTGPLGYRLRGERCEGLYVAEVSGSAILVAAWTMAFDDFESAKVDNVVLAWDAPDGAGPVHLRAQGLRRRLYYRMDAVRPAGNADFIWPANVLGELQLARKDLGVLASTLTTVGGVPRNVLLPLRISGGAATPRRAEYELVLVPGTEFGEVYLSLEQVGTSPSVLRHEEALGYGYYPANRPLRIPVEGLSAKGFYRLTVAATLKSGGTATSELWLYHPGS